MSTQNIGQILSTTLTDALIYLTPLNILLLILALLASCFAGYYLFYLPIKKESRITLFNTGFISLFFFILFFQVLNSHVNLNNNTFWPLGAADSLRSKISAASREIKKMHSLLSAITPYENVQADTPTELKNQGVICILHVGESLRADHLGINGYHRNTTPWLSQQPNVINFSECISSAIMTNIAMLTMLTNAQRAVGYSQDAPSKPSSGGIIDYFAHAGFNCAAYWAEGTLSSPDSNLFSAEAFRFSSCCHKIGTIGFKHFKQQEEASKWLNQVADGRTNLFIMFNNKGSHSFFDNYDESNPPFPPVTLPSCTDRPHNNPKAADNMKNAYDCTVHLTDEFIRRLLTPLQGKPFLYVYMSDHGEYLGEDGYWTRGSVKNGDYHNTTGCKVPFFMIASPEFEELHPHYKKSLENLRANQSVITGHEHLFHTLLGIFAIKTEDYNPSLDLSSPDVKPYMGPRPH